MSWLASVIAGNQFRSQETARRDMPDAETEHTELPAPQPKLTDRTD